MDLLKEMEDYKNLLENQGKDIMERIIRLSGITQNKDVSIFTELLNYDHNSVSLRIDLIKHNIEITKETLLEKEEA